MKKSPKIFFEKFSNKLREEKKEIEKQLKKSPLKESNQNQFIEKSLKIISNLREMWTLGDYCTRQMLQNLIFPEGIFYNKKNDKCRTERMNFVFDLICNLSTSYMKNKKGGTE